MGVVIDTLDDEDIADDTLKRIYEKLIVAFEDHDCDTLCECLDRDPIFDEVYRSMYPEDEW